MSYWCIFIGTPCTTCSFLWLFLTNSNVTQSKVLSDLQTFNLYIKWINRPEGKQPDTRFTRINDGNHINFELIFGNIYKNILWFTWSWPWCLVTQNLGCDTMTPTGHSLLHVFCGINNSLDQDLQLDILIIDLLEMKITKIWTICSKNYFVHQQRYQYEQE